jgi:branched-chain amino acid transport system substrate-binding protein
MKKIFLVLILLSIIYCGCTKNENTFKVGVNLPLSGNVSYYGISARKGIELALEEIKAKNEFKNVNIQLIYEDNQGQAKLSINAITKLINVDKVQAVIGCGSSTETMAAAPIAIENKVILISPISSATSISKFGQFIFRSCPSDLIQAQDLADFVLESKKKRIAIIYANSTWGTGFKDNFVEYFKSKGGEILDIKSSDPGESNFRSQLSVLKALNPEALVFIIYAKEGGTLIRQTRELGMNQNIFGADPWSQKDLRIGAGNYSDGVMYTTPVQYAGEVFYGFREKYLNKYKEEPDVYSSNGYDCMMLLANGYIKGCRTGEQFRDFLRNVSDFIGATGPTRFDVNGDVIGKKFGRFVIVNGEPKEIIK